MAHDYLLFITWRTWAGARSVTESSAARLVELLPVLAREEQAVVLEIAVMADHVHVLVELSGATSIARLVQRFKGTTARFANRDGWSGDRYLRWEKGYDSRTVGRRAVPAVQRYFDEQSARHQLPLLARWSAQGVNSLLGTTRG